MTTASLRLSANVFCERVLEWWKRGREMGLRIGRRAPKRLRLCESLPLGERRFVAVVEFEATRFLVGGTASSLVLLSRLPDGGKLAVEPESNLEKEAAEQTQPRGKKC